MEVIVATPTDPRWPEFVARFADANIFHSPAMAEVWNGARATECIPLLALAGGEVVAAAFPVLVPVSRRFRSRLTNRLILYASPLAVDGPVGSEGLRMVMDMAAALAARKALFLEVRNSRPFTPPDGCRHRANYSYLAYQNYLVDLRRGPDELWAALGKYTRNHVRKPEKRGAVIRDLTDSDLPAAVAMIEALYQRKAIPVLPTAVFFEAAARLPRPDVFRAIGLYTGSELMGVRFSLNHGGVVYDWYAASAPAANDLHANEALAWETIRRGAERGFHTFDFGGGAIAGQTYGPARFKEKFRGALVEYGRWRLAAHPRLYQLATRAYETLRARRKREE